MRFSIDLRPTLTIAREPTRAYQAALVAMAVVAAACFGFDGWYYWHALARVDKVTADEAKFAAERDAVMRDRKNHGLSPGDQKALEGERDVLHRCYGERRPAAALVLAGVEAVLPAACRLTALTLERSNGQGPCSVQLRGAGRSAAAIGAFAETLQRRYSCTVNLASVRHENELWLFELSTRMSIPASLLSTEATDVTTKERGEP